MISIGEARDIIVHNLPKRQTETVTLQDASGRVLAEDIVSVEPSPRYTNSAMDGFAVRWADVEKANGAGGVTLKIVGESQAGIPFGEMLEAGKAARISTGAMICKGADTVIPIEETEIEGSALRVLKANTQHQHLRFEGEEFGVGELLLPDGKLLNASRIAVLASQGITEVTVYRQPEAAIILTGTELVPYDQPLERWQIRDSNGIMLETAVRESGGVVNLTASVGDNYEDTVAAVEKASESANLIIFSGGVSVGPHDLVKKAAQECGFETMFWRVKQRPGKPLFFAKKDDILFFGLPGNPVSAYMCYLYYIHPLLQFLQGKPFAYKSVKGEIGEPIENKISRAQLFRISLKEAEGHSHPLVYPLSKQGSHMLTSLSSAEGFILLEVGANLKKGELIDVILWNE